MSHPDCTPEEAIAQPARAELVTKGDDALPGTPKALYIGTGGDLVLRGINDSADRTWKNVPSGFVLPFLVKFVRASSTAADILALY